MCALDNSRMRRTCGALPPHPVGVLGTFAVTVPTGTTTVAGDAFSRCKGLAQVTLPATVTVIEDGESKRAKRTMPANLQPAARHDAYVIVEVVIGAFSFCTSLSEITLPPNLEKIGHGQYAFCQCTSLSEITLPPNLTKIGRSAFAGCTSLVEITLPPNLTEIGDYVFYECTSLSEITLPPNLTEIGEFAFEECTSLSEITLPPNLTQSHRDWRVRLLRVHVLG